MNRMYQTCSSKPLQYRTERELIIAHESTHILAGEMLDGTLLRVQVPTEKYANKQPPANYLGQTAWCGIGHEIPIFDAFIFLAGWAFETRWGDTKTAMGDTQDAVRILKGANYTKQNYRELITLALEFVDTFHCRIRSLAVYIGRMEKRRSDLTQNQMNRISERTRAMTEQYKQDWQSRIMSSCGK